MRELFGFAAISVLGLAAGNFAYQATAAQDWAVALERSYFMGYGVVIFTFWLVLLGFRRVG